MTLPPDPSWCARINAHKRREPEPAPPPEPPALEVGDEEECEICGSTRLEWRKCKLVCLHCRQILKSCADL